MELSDATVLVTGSIRGLGRELVTALVSAGAKKIYATAREPSAVSDLVDGERVLTLPLDITDPLQVSNAAEQCSDTNLLINNAGKNFNVPLIASDSIGPTRTEVETNYLGTLQMCRAF